MSKNFILGTAGHIDHGKTTLVKRLTGIDADRFEEEKKRGITIDLGFAYFDLPDGNRVGVVDVPGHERFIKNMLAGASGIDIVMFVVAADEGIMPQTLEHVDILSLLGVKRALFVVTKIDLVDDEMLLLVEEEISTLIEKTIFEESKIKYVSSETGEGIDDLIEEIKSSFAEVNYEIKAENPRLPIDRVFSVNGFGTVVTGTLIDGEISVGDVLYVFPNQIEVKVKNIQVHSENVSKAYHGQRVAINLQGIKREELKRGDVISVSNALTNSMMIDAKIKLLERSPYELKNWTRLRLYHGTKEILCRLVLLDKEILSPGEEAFVQLRLEDTISAKLDDNFVLRFYSPMITVAGGTILDPVANKHKRFNESVLESLRIRDEEDIETIVDKLVLENSQNFENVYEVLKKLGKMNSEIDDIVRNLNTVKQIGNNIYIHIDFIKKLEEEIAEFLNKYHANNSLALGIPKEEFRQKFFSKLKGKSYEDALKLFIDNQIIELVNSIIALYGFEIQLSKKQKVTMETIEKIYVEGGFTPPSILEIKKTVNFSKKELEYLINLKKIVKISEELYFDSNFYSEAKVKLVTFLEANNEITVAGYRDLIETSRKTSILLLEHFDGLKLTKRMENIRQLI